MEVKEASAAYSALVEDAAGEALAVGYRRTDVGVIPEDWINHSIRKIAAKRQNAIVGGPFGSDLVSKDYVQVGVPVVRGQNMSGHYVSGDFVFVSSAKARQLQANVARHGDIVFTQRGTLGQVALVPSKPFDGYIISQSQMKLTLNSDVMSAEYVYQYFKSNEGQKQILVSAIQTGVPHTNLGILKNYRVPAPPTKVEQTAIALALSDADALVESLEQLLAKKRQIKQGAMQALLTGKKRLAGFSGAWPIRSLGELFSFGGGYTASRDQLGEQGYSYLHYGDIHTSGKSFINVEAEYQGIPKLDVALKKVSPVSLLKDGDVVFVDASEDDEGTSKHVAIYNANNRPFISGLHTIVAKSKTDELVHEYRRHCFHTPAVKNQFRFFSVGTKVSGISKTNIAKITMPVPSAAEQNAIAAILFDMDAELAALEARIVKARQLKKGMMQELLTGRTRLV